MWPSLRSHLHPAHTHRLSSALPIRSAEFRVVSPAPRSQRFCPPQPFCAPRPAPRHTRSIRFRCPPVAPDVHSQVHGPGLRRSTRSYARVDARLVVQFYSLRSNSLRIARYVLSRSSAFYVHTHKALVCSDVCSAFLCGCVLPRSPSTPQQHRCATLSAAHASNSVWSLLARPFVPFPSDILTGNAMQCNDSLSLELFS